jgi:hypothetical protein
MGGGPRTANRKHLSPGDKAIFYLAGPNNQTFVAAAALASPTYEDEAARANLFSDPTTYRIDLSDIVSFSKPIPRRSIAGLEWAPVMNGTSRISAEDYQRILNADGLAPAIPSMPSTHEGEDTASFYLERYLEDFIVDNWSSIFGNTLTIYTDKDNNVGRQYYTQEVGYIDILAQDKQGNFVVIELKKGRKDDEVIGQVLRYIGWVRRNLAKPSQEVRGMIIVGDRSPKLSYALQEVASKIDVKVYRLSFGLEAY